MVVLRVLCQSREAIIRVSTVGFLLLLLLLRRRLAVKSDALWSLWHDFLVRGSDGNLLDRGMFFLRPSILFLEPDVFFLDACVLFL